MTGTKLGTAQVVTIPDNMVEAIARAIVDHDDGELWRFGIACIVRNVRRLHETGDAEQAYCQEVEEDARSYLWESLRYKVRQLAGRTDLAPADLSRLIVASAAKHATWRARRAASAARRLSGSKGAVSEPCATDCPVDERPERGWIVAEFVGRVKTDDSAAGAKLAAQLKAAAILAASGVSTRGIGDALGVSHETARKRLALLAEFLPGKRRPTEDETELSLAELELTVGAQFVRRKIARRRAADMAASEEARRAASERHLGAGRIRRRGAVGAASYVASGEKIMRGGFRRPGLSRQSAELIVWRDARYVARLLDGLRPLGGRVVDWQAASVESAPLSVMLAAPAAPQVDKAAAQSFYDAPRFTAAAHRMAARIQERRAASAAGSAASGENFVDG